MPPDTISTNPGTRAAGTSTISGRHPDGKLPGHQDDDTAGLLTATATALASLGGKARQGGMETEDALSALTAARSLTAELEHGELAFIEAARGSGATWAQIAAAMGARNRQTAQKRHADLARRCARPPSVDAPPAPEPCRQDATHDNHSASTTAPGNSPPARKGRPVPDRGMDRPGPRTAPSPTAADTAATSPAPSQREQPLPTITSAIITESQYELVRAPGHHETRAWHVLVGGTRVGLARPTWRGERSRPGWEPVDGTGVALPATGIGRVTPAGNARTRDAAAVSLLRALQHQQESARKRKRSR